MTDPQITPQQPGDVPAVNTAHIDALRDGNVGDLIEGLDGLSDLDLEALAQAEAAGKNRSTAVSAIQREQERRKADALDPATAPESEATPIGDTESYARMRAAEIDPRKLERPVLSMDGWVLPLPRTSPEA